MNQYLLDLLRNNPLTTAEIVDWVKRFPREDVESGKVEEGLASLRALGLVELVGDTWERAYPIVEVKAVKVQREIFV